MSALADQFTRFLDERRWLLNVTPKTLEWYEEMFKLLRRLHPTLTEPADLTKPTLNQFVVKMRERGLSAVSCNTRLKAVNVFVGGCTPRVCSRRNSTSRRSGPRSACCPSSAPSR